MSEAEGWLERKVQWFSVADRLPPVGRCVLAATSGGAVHEAYRSNRENWKWATGELVATITHWVEFPNPPAQFELERVKNLIS